MTTTLKTTPPTLPVPDVVAEIVNHNDADTYGWDTVFSIRFNDANTAIADNWSSVSDKVKNFSQAASDAPSYNAKGILGPWQLTVGGDGKNIRMVCPFIEGTYEAGGTRYNLKDYKVVIEVGMEWVPDPDQFAFTVAGNDKVNQIVSALDKSTISQILKDEFAAQQNQLSDSATVTVIKNNLEWMIADGKSNYYIFFNIDKYQDQFLHIYMFEDAWRNNLKFLQDEVSKEQPAVVIVTIENNKTSGIAAAVLPELMSEWFNANIGDFNYVFSVLDLSPQLSKSDKYHWIKPTSTSYAVTDNGTLDNSVFGVLTMTQNRTAASNHQVSNNAIPMGTGSNSANAGFLINGTVFLQNMMLSGARAIFCDAEENDFTVTNDGLTIQNNAKLTWGRFKKDDSPVRSISAKFTADLDAGNLTSDLQYAFGHWESMGEQAVFIGIDVSGYAIEVTEKGKSWFLSKGESSPEYLLEKDGENINAYTALVVTIEKNQFKMSLIHSYLELEFIDLKYPESWEYDVHINFTEQVQLSLKEIDGRQIFWYDQIARNMTVNVTKTKAAVTVGIVEDVIMTVLGLAAVAAPLIDGLRGAIAVGEVTEDAGSAMVTARGFQEAYRLVEDDWVLLDEVDAGTSAARQVRGGWTGFKNAFTATRWKVLGGIAGAVGAIVGGEQLIYEIIENCAKGDWEKVPAFDEFANEVVVPYNWPGVSGYDLKCSWLASSLQIGLKAR
ncbi:P-47 protein [Desulfotomaculum arcticum]|uniref:p-47 protein n=1 Tax=Desulfotruncus arcticus DSM 17038 TaxID=1121424 RepID=A0A1I2TLI4_9FIRM|nr:TULIP family P47-like protein [Desulfotruncus arcticus]SFG63181.1 P-47 protein [Desulfotomaculum arcticum] [Desulfotruncus arcticus DSM 17038]